MLFDNNRSSPREGVERSMESMTGLKEYKVLKTLRQVCVESLSSMFCSLMAYSVSFKGGTKRSEAAVLNRKAS